MDEVAHHRDDLTQFEVLYDQVLRELIERQRAEGDEDEDDQDPGTPFRSVSLQSR
ncbi:hypothetical protein GCM10010988_02060 [Cnuibacter physcomitrellae]|nr:hypothetical protein GCM10010988_02060 [Cnuibacter physcomitrellae]